VISEGSTKTIDIPEDIEDIMGAEIQALVNLFSAPITAFPMETNSLLCFGGRNL